MKWTLRAEHLFYVGFSIIVLRQPLQFLIGPESWTVLALGVVLCSGSLLTNARNLRLAKPERFLAGFALLVFILHGLLGLLGVSGDSHRTLWFSGLAQLLAVVLLLHYRQSPKAWRFFKMIFVTALVVECTFAFLQVSYYSTGIGLAPVFDEYENVSFVSGSFFNANDFSVFVAICSMALYCCWSLEQKENRGYFIVALAMMAIFVSLSRTAFVFISLFAFLVLLGGAGRIASAPLKKANVLTLGLLIFVPIVVLYLLGTVFLTNTSVFERSIQRIDQVFDITTDESASSRFLVHFRFLENIHNLWIGTFADQSYSRFFNSEDPALMKVNPHSFLVEMAFLYGWPGLISAIGLVGLIAVGIMKNRDIPVLIRCVAASSLLFFQSVPASILANSSFLLPYLLLVYCRRDLLTSK